MVYPDQEEVHKCFLFSCPLGTLGEEGVMKLNPPPPFWEDLSAGGTTQMEAENTGLPQDIPSPPIPPSPEQITVPGTGTTPGEVSFEDIPRPGSVSPSWPPHCGEFTG